MLLDRDWLGMRDVDQVAKAVLSFLRDMAFMAIRPILAIVSKF